MLKALTVILSYDCNLSCSWCSQNHIEKTPMDTFKMVEVFKKTLIDNPQIESVGLIGGEPTLYPEIMDKLSSIAVAQDKKISIATNGMLWTPQLVAWANANNISVNISFHGLSVGEKPINAMPTHELRYLDNLKLTTVYQENTSWIDDALAACRLLDCGVFGIAYDTEAKHSISKEHIYDLRYGINILKEAGIQAYIKDMHSTPCECLEQGHLGPDGTLMVQPEFLKLDGLTCTEGCVAWLKGNPELYPLLKKILN